MSSPFLHLEVLGPRERLDAWLGALQDVGVCHLADALHDLEGEAGIGRPALTPEEIDAQLARSEAAQALRGVQRVLPPTARHAADRRRPAWSIAAGGIGEQEVLALRDEARGIAGSVRAALERARGAEDGLTQLDAQAAALKACEAAGRDPTGLRVLYLPWGPRRARRLERTLRRRGLEARRADGERTSVILLAASDEDDARVRPAVDAVGAQWLPPPLAGDGEALDVARARVGTALEEARRADGDARAALTARLGEVGPRGRLLLDSLEDAEARLGSRRFLAASEHVAAARVYVRREDEAALRDRLRGAAGDWVVVRPRAALGDEPSLPRPVAAAPLAAIRGLAPGRFADASLAAVLALLTPLAVGLAWSDIGGGVLLFLAGGLLGRAAGPGSPRRDTALMAQVGGLVAIVLGWLSGRAFGAAGDAWFGTDWPLLPDLPRLAALQPVWLQPFVTVLAVLGALAGLLALWGLALTLRAGAAGHAVQARGLLVALLHYVVLTGLAAGALGSSHPLYLLWIAAPAAALAVLLLAGPRRFLTRLCLDLVGVLRLVAVAGAALLLFQVVVAGWVDPGVTDLLLGPLALFVAALAVVADPAHLAMGVPYDLSLGGRRLGRVFDPLRRAGDPLREAGYPLREAGYPLREAGDPLREAGDPAAEG